MSGDVAIVGVGLHPFGRFPGVTAIEMGAVAIRRALADAGVEWRDIGFAFAGSYEVDNPDAVVALIGPHRHPLHRRVQRLRDRGERALRSRRRRSASVSTGSASRSGWTSTCPARSARIRASTRARSGTATSGSSSPRSSSG